MCYNLSSIFVVLFLFLHPSQTPGPVYFFEDAGGIPLRWSPTPRKSFPATSHPPPSLPKYRPNPPLFATPGGLLFQGTGVLLHRITGLGTEKVEKRLVFG